MSEKNGFNRNAATPIAVEWPKPISDAGMYGISGELVRLVEEHTEGDRNVILLAFLAYAGNLIGREYYVATGADRQCANLFVCNVGPTSGGRKGSGVSAAGTFFSHGSCAPQLPKILYGISSGEGVIHQIRDPKIKHELNRKTQKVEEITIDAGVTDKRVLFCLSEFQQCLAAMRRQDSILASIIRQAWDKGAIAAPSKNNESFASNSHISIIGSISKEELLAETTAADAQNGTLNRFLFTCSQRSRLLPEGGKLNTLYESDKWTDIQYRFSENIRAAARGQIIRDVETQNDWGRDASPDDGLYKKLSEPRIGLWGALTARAAQQVIRLSLIFAIINGHQKIQTADQDAAYECWRYCDDSVKYVFGNRMQDPRAVRILVELRKEPIAGLSRSEMLRTFRVQAEDLNKLLQALSELGVIYCRNKKTEGRDSEQWFATM